MKIDLEKMSCAVLAQSDTIYIYIYIYMKRD